jgi:predicted permease
VAVLLLGVASERNGELALRAALGAGPAGLGRLFLAESLVCCGVGAALGLPLAGAAVRVFLGVYPGGLPRADEVAGGAVVWGAGAALVLVLIALGTLPQHRRARRLDIGSALMSGGRVSSDRRAARFRATLVVFQLTLCTSLLTVGTLLVRLYLETVATPPGFASEEVVAFNVTPPSARYMGQPEYLAFYDDLLQRIRAQPGVRAASYTSLLPFDRDDWREGFVREGAPDNPEEELFVLFQRVEPSYTEVLGLPLLAGRRLTDSDRDGTPRVGLVNEALARRWFGGTEAIGKRIGRGDRWIEIVGVVGDKRHRELSQEPLLELFVPRRQETGIRSMWIVVRSSEDPSLLLGRMREVLHQTDPSIPFAYATVMTDRIALSTAPQRFRSLLLASLAGMALLLATLGVWGLSSFRVGRETRDIGVRLALGMSPSRARARVLGTALLTAVPGVTVGALLTLLSTQLVDASLFGVPEIDPVSLLGVPAFLIVVTVATALRPAWRAGSVDPIRTMGSS